MAVRTALNGLSRTRASQSSLPLRGAGGFPYKPSMRPDKPLPLWYDYWIDNGVYPGQLVVDFIDGRFPANRSVEWYAKMYAVIIPVLGIPLWYCFTQSNELRMPYVPRQYPDDVYKVLYDWNDPQVRFDFSRPKRDYPHSERATFMSSYHVPS